MSNRLKKIIIIIFSALLMFLGSYNFVVKNLRHKYFMARQDRKFLAEKLKENKGQIKQAALDKKQIVKLNEIYQEENKKLIAISLSLLLDQLTKAAQSSGVVLQSVQPLAAKEQGLMALYPLQFAIVGTYNQIQKFTATLVDLFSYILWQNIKLTKITYTSSRDPVTSSRGLTAGSGFPAFAGNDSKDAGNDSEDIENDNERLLNMQATCIIYGKKEPH